MLIERVELRFLDLPLVEPFVAAHGATTSREIVVVRVEGDGGWGWGECSALPEPTYTSEFAAGAFAVLDEELIPRLIGHELTGTTVLGRLAVVAGNPMAKAALEMALLDVDLRSAGTSLAEWLGAPATRVPAGAAVGMAAVDAVSDGVERLASEGFGRVKLKIAPGHDLDIVAAVQARVGGVEIQVDGNGSYRAEHLDTLVEIASSGISAIEQPFPPDLVEVAASLVEVSPVPIVADEAAESTAAIERIRRRSALSGVSIKPPRLGGLTAARHLHDRCVDWDLPATAGGMVEAGLGRHALAAFAALPGLTIAGDVSPARRWLAADPWPDLELSDGMITVPTTPGIAPEPDPDVLERYTVERIDVAV